MARRTRRRAEARAPRARHDRGAAAATHGARLGHECPVRTPRRRRQMNTANFDALLWLETRRDGPLVLRLIGATIVVLGLFAAFGRATAENVVAIALGSGFGAVLIVPMTVSRDKLERTMDFLRSLPTTASEIAAARFAAAALSALPNAVLAGAALLVVDLPAPFDFVSGRFAVAATVALWILLTTAAWLLIAASAAFELSSLLSWPLIALVLFALVLPRVGA